MTTQSTSRTPSKRQQEKAERAALFRELVTQIDAGLKAEQAASQEGKYTAQLARVAKTPALQGLQRYSQLNQLLILAQCPHATDTAGYVTWKERGYQVRSGEKAIYIIAPHEKTRQGGGDQKHLWTDQEESRSIGFHRTPVFDISQVDPIKEDDQAAAYDVDAADEADMKAYEAVAPEGGEGKQEEPNAAASESAAQ